MNSLRTCQWIEGDAFCKCPAIPSKSYCITHHKQVYLTLPAEMADYIIEKELQQDINFINSLTKEKTRD